MANVSHIPGPRPGALAKRLSLKDQLDRLTQATDDERWEVLDEVEKLHEKYKGFRFMAPKTKARQDHHLEMYKQFQLFKYKKQEHELTEDEMREFLFPADDTQKIFADLRQFLIFVYLQTSPRARLTSQLGDHISYRTLGQYRDSMGFWIRRSFRERSLVPPAFSEINHYMTEAMRGVVKDFPVQPSQKKVKPHIGLPEMRQMFDYDALQNRSIEFAEQHWAAWCIARCTACRPGSICVSDRKLVRNPPLKWDDLKFTVGDEPGKFDLIIMFNNIRIKGREDPEEENRAPKDTSLHVYLGSPASSNLIFSAAHRLLVIALRRGIIDDGIDTIEDLKSASSQEIKIKPEALNQPLFFKGVSKGTGVDYSQALTVSALDEYLKRVAYRLGWNIYGLGMNSFRRRMLSDLIAMFGYDTARRFAGHSTESQTLERFYQYVNPFFNATAAALNEPRTTTGFEDRLRADWAPLAAGRLDQAAVDRTRGATLRAMTDRFALEDENPPPNVYLDANVRKAYRKRLRRAAHFALLEYERKVQSISKEEAQAREASLHASEFAKNVMARAREILPNITDNNENTYSDWNGFSDEMDQQDQNGDPDEVEEPDLEDSAVDGPQKVTMPLEAEMDADVEADSDLSYRQMATAFMSSIMENSSNVQHTWAEGDPTCPDCRDDPSVSLGDKAKVYLNAQHLENHRNSNFHSPVRAFTRNVLAAQADHPENEVTCPYCEEAGDERVQYYASRGVPPPPSTYKTVKELETHIKESTNQSDGKRHDELKELGGWYSQEFYEKPLAETRKKQRQVALKKMARMGIDVVHQRQVPGTEPFPGFPGAVLGSHDAIPDRFASSPNLRVGESTLGSLIPAKFAKSVTVGVAPQPVPEWVSSNTTTPASQPPSRPPQAPSSSRRPAGTATASALQRDLAQRRLSAAAEIGTAADPMVIDDNGESDEDEDEDGEEDQFEGDQMDID